MRDFLWELGEEKKDHLIRWEVVCRSKEEGGLGLGNVVSKNEALLGKWLWRWPLERERLWHEVVKSIHGCSESGWDAGVSQRALFTTPWKAISGILPKFLSFVRWNLPSEVKLLFTPAAFGRLTKRGKLMWKCIRAATLWTVWEEKNARIFQKQERSLAEIKECILTTTISWLKSSHLLADYSFDDLRRNWAAMAAIVSTKIKSQAEWIPPPPDGVVKLNFDGSSQGNPRPLGIGGILRDKDSNMLSLFSGPVCEGDSVRAELLAAVQGGLLIGRTIAVLLTMTLATSMAAQEGPIPMAGYQVCLQVWLAISLLNDALALSGQALLAGDYSQGNYKQARHVVYRTLQSFGSIQIGLVTGIALAVMLFIGFEAFSGLFSTDSAVLGIARSGILFVAGSQPMNALAFVLDGLYYGVSDFGYAAYSMVLVGLVSSVFLLIATPLYGLSGVWAGLFLFMTLRVVAGFWRLSTKGGPWKMVWSEIDQKND
ncbi:PREDICTED: uncharacterized protein LOC104592815 isoform X3 [Nelumbo nucifera]|uniref:Protein DETOXIFICATION n=1 Tax=Nelumbo nucifera TaxID=4432 RepID=A0A1U7ZGM4_NELNU|nr:PREDICTED: uncharacterized protein LOC104592815 isoform X3 [Nelumbo nucifera]